jgi:hypothetical protein
MTEKLWLQLWASGRFNQREGQRVRRPTENMPDFWPKENFFFMVPKASERPSFPKTYGASG